MQFGEAMAILAGDALLTLAFELLTANVVGDAHPTTAVGGAYPTNGDSRRAVALVGELARAAGRRGMIGGQVADVEGECQPIALHRVEHIHLCKTARLLQAACRMGALSGGGASAQLDSLGVYGLHLGLAFQIADDLLDVTASVEQAGKSVGKDACVGKQTYPACVGMEASRSKARGAADESVAALEAFGTEAQALRELARYVVERAC